MRNGRIADRLHGDRISARELGRLQLERTA
jgi:hypothetical protein